MKFLTVEMDNFIKEREAYEVKVNRLSPIFALYYRRSHKLPCLKNTTTKSADLATHVNLTILHTIGLVLLYPLYGGVV